MDSQKVTIQKDLIFEQLRKTVSALGEQIKLAPTFASNHSAHDVTKTEITPQQLKILLENQDKYGGYKIHASSQSPLDKHLFLVIDYDDHSEGEDTPTVKERRIALHSKFNLPPTFTVKTPTGDGVHEYYLITKDLATEIGKWSQLVGLPQIPSTEIKLGLPTLRTGFPGPGTYRDGGYYTILEEIKPVKISEEFSRFLLSKRLKEKEEFAIPTGITSETDSSINVANAQSYINEATLPYLLKQKPPCYGAEDSRNKKLYSLAMECFRRNLSIDMASSLLEPINTNLRIFSSALDEDEFDATIKSAWDNVQQNKLYHSKAIDPDLEPFKKDEYGQKVMSYESYRKKAELLCKYSKDVIMNDERLKKLFFELIIMHGSTYYIPHIATKEMVDEECARQLKDAAELGTTISVDSVAKLLSETTLHWTALNVADINAKYKSINLQGKPEIITKCKQFNLLHTDVATNGGLVRSSSPTFNRENIYEKGRFYMIEQAPVRSIKSDSEEYPTPKEFEIIKDMLDRHIRRIVDPNNFEEEKDFLLGRYALLLQKPNTRTENILILRGEQGTGKSAFFNLFRPLFHGSQTKNFDSSSRLENNFTNLAYISHFDDCPIDFDKGIVDKLKNVSTSATQYEEKKGIDAVEVIRPVNISLTTNRDIDNMEVLSGRRWTILNNSEIPDRELIREDVFNTLTRLLENDLRLYKVFATYMQEFDARKFKPNFKSLYQREKCSELSKGHPFIRRLLGVVVNYGYYSPDIRILDEGECIARLDLFDTLRKHKELKGKKREDNIRVTSLFLEIEDKTTKDRIAHFWKKVIPQHDKQLTSKISGKSGFTYLSPTIQDLIKIIAVFMYDSIDASAIESVINKYKLEPHWNWKVGDEMLIPEGSTLGDIDPFAYIDPDEIEDEDDDF